MKRAYHLQDAPIPEGLQIFEDDVEVAGIHLRKAAAAKFIKGVQRHLEFEREPSNAHDQNAIKVIGVWRGTLSMKRAHLGYVPRDTAQQIIEGGFWGQAAPRLKRTYLGDEGFVEVLFQVLGPVGGKGTYNQAAPAYRPPAADADDEAEDRDRLDDIYWDLPRAAQKKLLASAERLARATSRED